MGGSTLLIWIPHTFRSLTLILSGVCASGLRLKSGPELLGVVAALGHEAGMVHGQEDAVLHDEASVDHGVLDLVPGQSEQDMAAPGGLVQGVRGS